ncbi:MAG: hypothetical protein ABI574_04655 [Burkholderiales bacterium]
MSSCLLRTLCSNAQPNQEKRFSYEDKVHVHSTPQWGMSMRYINVHGEPVNVDATGPKKSTTKRAEPLNEFHKGFAVLGFSPAHLAAAEQEHAHKAAEAKRNGRSLQPWSEEAYMRLNKPKKVRSKPYESRSAAVACAEIAAKQAGWKGLRVDAVVKGGQA